MQKIEWLCRIAPSLGDGFDGTPEKVWGTQKYEVPFFLKNLYGDIKQCVFFGLYGLPDFFDLWRHHGKKYILWAGSDITNFVNGYWLDEKGRIKLNPSPLAKWINENCDSYVENAVEYEALKKVGIICKVVPSFLGNVEDYKVSYKLSDRPKLYTSVSGNDFKLYGWDKIPLLAQKNPSIEFHLYGNTIPFPLLPKGLLSNVIVHGRVSKEQMNEEIKDMQGAIRLTEFDGFSEIIAKSLLWGQWPVSLIDYPHVLKVSDIDTLPFRTYANDAGRSWLLSVVNKYPWNQK